MHKATAHLQRCRAILAGQSIDRQRLAEFIRAHDLGPQHPGRRLGNHTGNPTAYPNGYPKRGRARR